MTDRKSTFEAQGSKPLTSRQLRLLDQSLAIRESLPDRTDFLHSVMCQVGLPRRATEARAFERHSGPFSILVEAGKLYNGRDWIDQPLPYGATPRLVMVHLSSEAIRTQNRRVELGDSMRQFLQALGLQTNGGARGGYTVFRKQMEALAACRLTIGMQNAGRVVTVDAKPIKRFEAWFQPEADGQQSLWPGSLELSPDFYETLRHHAVPLDHRALAVLKHSALALDIYTWLAHRLCRIRETGGLKLSWENLRDQFGVEYRDIKDFKREFRNVFSQVWQVYPNARVHEEFGGLRLYESPPPIPKTFISLAGSRLETPPVDKPGEG